MRKPLETGIEVVAGPAWLSNWRWRVRCGTQQTEDKQLAPDIDDILNEVLKIIKDSWLIYLNASLIPVNILFAGLFFGLIAPIYKKGKKKMINPKWKINIYP